MKEDTICAISTSMSSPSAISIVRISGPDAVSIVSKIFSNKKFSSAQSHTIHYGFIIDQPDKKIDEVLVMKMLSPNTYTTEDIVEINCHGSYITTNQILELLLQQGARLAEPGEFTKRAFLNGRIDLLEAESVSDMIEAKTEHATRLAMNGISGKITKLIRDLREEMVNILTNIEVNIDYPEYEDEVVITNEIMKPKMKEIHESLQNILKESKQGKIIKQGIKVALIGKPNVGKSSLLNALMEEEKAIVTDISGTTRDIIEGTVNLNGILIHLLDTAGIRETEDVVEKIGVEKSKQALTDADLVILVLNQNETLSEEDKTLLKLMEKKKSIIFLNKNDLPKNLDISQLSSKNIVDGNTKTKTGLDALKNQISEMFHLNEIELNDLNFLSNARQINLIKKSLENIQNVEREIEEEVPIEILEMELKEAWNNLGLIIGETYEEELIDKIFQKFCLGK